MIFEKVIKYKQKTDKKVYMKYKTQNQVHEAMQQERLKRLSNLIEFTSFKYDFKLPAFSQFTTNEELPSLVRIREEVKLLMKNRKSMRTLDRISADKLSKTFNFLRDNFSMSMKNATKQITIETEGSKVDKEDF